jgi:hypothetical protein
MGEWVSLICHIMGSSRVYQCSRRIVVREVESSHTDTGEEAVGSHRHSCLVEEESRSFVAGSNLAEVDTEDVVFHIPHDIRILGMLRCLPASFPSAQSSFRQ